MNSQDIIKKHSNNADMIELKRNYQILCANCHFKKTNVENAYRMAGIKWIGEKDAL